MKNISEITAGLPRIIVRTENGEKTAENARELCFDDVRAVLDGAALRLTAQTTPVCSVTLSWECDTPAECIVLGDHWERGYGDMGWAAPDAARALPWYFAVRDGKNVYCCGVKTRPDALCFFTFGDGRLTLTADVCNGSSGVILNGKTLCCAELVSAAYEGDSFRALCDFTGLLASGAVFPDKPVYGFNNWYYAYGDSSHEEILANTAHLARLTKGLENRPFMVIDDGWQKDHGDYNGGPWREGNEKFPDMEGLARAMAEMDVIPGIWIRPLQNRDKDLTPDRFCYPEDDILDPTQPENLEYIAEDVRTITGWGYKLIKHDYSGFDLLGEWGSHLKCAPSRFAKARYADRSVTNAQIIKTLYKTIYEAADGKALIIGCNCFAHLGVGYFHIHRSGDDTSGRSFDVTREKGVNTMSFRRPQHGTFFFMDGDCAGLTKKIPWELNKRWLTLLAKSGTPLFVSVAPDTLDDEQNAYLAEMLAIASREQQPADPIAWEESTLPACWRFEDGEQTFDWFNP